MVNDDHTAKIYNEITTKSCSLDFITTISSIQWFLTQLQNYYRDVAKFTTISYKPCRESNPGLKISYYAGCGHWNADHVARSSCQNY